MGILAWPLSVLLNEIRRTLARAARRHARQLQPAEALTVATIAEGLPVPWAEVTAVMLAVRAWAYSWHRSWVQRFEEVIEAGTLEISSSAGGHRMTLAGHTEHTDPMRFTVLPERETRVRVANHGPVGLHLRVELVGFADRAGTSVGIRQRTLVDTRRGIGLVAEPMVRHASAADAGVAPWRYAPSRRSAANPRRLATRPIIACAFSDDDGEQLVGTITELLSVVAVDPSGAWLAADNVDAVARDVWVAALGDEPRRRIGGLICSLAEWHSPGLHPPHRSGHPGGHPLGPEVRAAVAKWQAHRATAPPTGNAASQARSRLYRLVAARLGGAAYVVHQEMSFPNFGGFT